MTGMVLIKYVSLLYRCVVGVCLTGALRAMAASSVQSAFLRAMDQLAAPGQLPLPGSGGNWGPHGKNDHDHSHGPGRPDVDWRSRGCAVELLAHVSLGVASENADQRVEASQLQINR